LYGKLSTTKGLVESLSNFEFTKFA